MQLSYMPPDAVKCRRPLHHALLIAGAVLWLGASLSLFALAAALRRPDLLPALPCAMVVALVGYLAYDAPLAKAFWQGVLLGVFALCGPLFFVGLLIMVHAPR